MFLDFNTYKIRTFIHIWT